MFITFLLFSNEVKLPPQSRPLIFVYLYTRTHYKPIQKSLGKINAEDVELFWNESVYESYRLKALITLEQMNNG